MNGEPRHSGGIQQFYGRRTQSQRSELVRSAAATVLRSTRGFLKGDPTKLLWCSSMTSSIRRRRAPSHQLTPAARTVVTHAFEAVVAALNVPVGAVTRHATIGIWLSDEPKFSADQTTAEWRARGAEFVNELTEWAASIAKLGRTSSFVDRLFLRTPRHQ